MIKLEFTKEEVAALISSCESTETLFALTKDSDIPDVLKKLVLDTTASALGKLRVANLMAASDGRSLKSVLDDEVLEDPS